MACTRFNDDPARIRKALEISTFSGRYALDVPGPGVHMPFQEDPQLRLQRWGANLHERACDLESALLGITHPLCKHPSTETYKEVYKMSSTKKMYPTQQPFVEESRAAMPAWTFRGRDQCYERWETRWLNPQDPASLEKPFLENVQTRILQKDVLPSYTRS